MTRTQIITEISKISDSLHNDSFSQYLTPSAQEQSRFIAQKLDTLLKQITKTEVK